MRTRTGRRTSRTPPQAVSGNTPSSDDVSAFHASRLAQKSLLAGLGDDDENENDKNSDSEELDDDQAVMDFSDEEDEEEEDSEEEEEDEPPSTHPQQSQQPKAKSSVLLKKMESADRLMKERRKRSTADDSSSSEEEDSEDDNNQNEWGRKKQVYYHSDSEEDSEQALLEARNLLLMAYCAHVSFFALLQAESKQPPPPTHPVVARLVELRKYLERCRSLEKKIQPQVRRLLDAAEGVAKASTIAAPNLSMLVAQDDDDDEDNGDGDDRKAYRPPKLRRATMDEPDSNGAAHHQPPPTSATLSVDDYLAALEAGSAPGTRRRAGANSDSEANSDSDAEANSDSDSDSSKKKKKATAQPSTAPRNKQLLNNKISLARELADELLAKPTEAATDGAASNHALQGFALREKRRQEKRAAVEEELMSRIPLTRKEKGRARAAERMARRARLDDFSEGVDALLANMKSNETTRVRDAFALGVDPSLSRRTKRARGGDDDAPRRASADERRAQHDDMLARRSAREARAAEDAEAARAARGVGTMDEMYAAAAAGAKRKRDKREERNGPRQTLPPLAPAVVDGEDGRRKISREIQKNRGLTPHRKRDAKNPRKKHRLSYEKATVRRKGQVVSAAKEQKGEGYGGELTGVRRNVVKARSLS
ncbi:hypothetical protein PPROV_000668500 [Pycnococcus provasolii]|uniref:Sas10 C-terminal domain-containing protein n=2 Tax=Pycnococcus provasolii TaxID=41880 RepID=A0A830HMM4_9CHLO|nr:hypothetical protein PPROV_000668500 [Pycnococcus provasolii]